MSKRGSHGATAGQESEPPSVAHGVSDAAVSLGLNAAIVTVKNYQPQILVIHKAKPSPKKGRAGHAWDSLPFGPFSPLEHRTLEIGLRSWVRAQTGLSLGYVDQLYTFGDQGRHARAGDIGPHIVSIGYLALTKAEAEGGSADTRWQPWYRFFPWEDWRSGKPEILSDVIEPRLREWAKRKPGPDEPQRALSKMDRLRIAFGLDGGQFDEEKTLERYELMYEAGLAAEAGRDGRAAAWQWPDFAVAENGRPQADFFGQPMQFDHRRILATAMGRLRGQLKYRPIIFEVMAAQFTLLELQKTVEAISGTLLHKQNFRRLVEQTGLVEATGETSTASGGRPAQLYRFRRTAILERPAPGLRVKAIRK